MEINHQYNFKQLEFNHLLIMQGLFNGVEITGKIVPIYHDYSLNICDKFYVYSILN